MTRRTNRRTRREPSRDEIPRVLVLCGGDNTEFDYFRGVKRERRNPAVQVVLKSHGCDPSSLVRRADRMREYADYDEVWCVVDVDEFDLTAAVAEAVRRNVKLAISNPCFEYWLILHFEKCVAPLVDYGDAERRLKRHVPHYDKTALRFDDFAPHVAVAVDRGRSLGVGCGAEHLANPATGVWSLVEIIL